MYMYVPVVIDLSNFPKGLLELKLYDTHIVIFQVPRFLLIVYLGCLHVCACLCFSDDVHTEVCRISATRALTCNSLLWAMLSVMSFEVGTSYMYNAQSVPYMEGNALCCSIDSANLCIHVYNIRYLVLVGLASDAAVAIATYIMPIPGPVHDITIDVNGLLGGILYPFALSFLIPVSIAAVCCSFQ